MRAFKRLSAIILAAAMTAGTASTALAAPQLTSASTSENAGYSFTYAEKRIQAGEAASSVLSKLGKAEKETVLTNCADSSGVDKSYTYKDGFDVITTKAGDKEIVKEITLYSVAVATEEGLKVGDASSAVKSIYPGAAGSLGLYTVTSGDIKLTIDCTIKDNNVVSITYEYIGKK